VKKMLEDLRAEDHANKLTRILLIDDHVSFRQALAYMLERQPEFKVVGEAGSLAEVRGLSGKSLKDVDVAVVDLALQDGDAFGLIEQFALNEPQVITLVLSASLESGRFARAVEAGAAGVLDKTTPIKDIIEALRRIRNGETLFSPEELVDLFRLARADREEERKARANIEQLTTREMEVLKALGRGLSNKEIAQSLHVSVGTERTHMMNILSKLGVCSRLQALVIAVRHGFVEIR
jgi:DNA-binding NarL/FixJ family response regulator